MKFLLGVHQPNWISRPEVKDIPLFVSYHRLKGRKTLPRAVGEVDIDSGGYSVLSTLGYWPITPAEYVRDVRRFVDEIGNIGWCASQDWMCEPHVLKKTGFSIEEHQRRTIDNYLELKNLAPELPFVPVLQGWQIASYWRCVEMYMARGVDLTKEPLVGLGSVCRRQAMTSAVLLLSTLAQQGLKLHGFGFKVDGLKAGYQYLASADSMAWSLQARIKRSSGEDPEADPNNLGYALTWRENMLRQLGASAPILSPYDPAMRGYFAPTPDLPNGATL